MRFHADLHVHSKHSRATSRDLDLEHLAHWAARKGIGVVGTGDCVHPVWLAELKDKLVSDTPGLFRLRPDLEAAVMATLPAPCRTPVRFMLSTEISTIYKKGDRTRKIHHLIYGPDFDTIDRLQASLARIGNIASDGRPILGLDSRDLLEIALASGPDAYLVPAHIWTPWFAALGSQSGFDSIGECYGDLSDHIFAVETGLSSDPAMNWRISFLDRYRLTSNSDAHSPGKLGREATAFDCDPDYHAIRRALETGEGYVGTVEFFPEEGKYHADGHRKCDVRLSPQETLARDGRCPVCGQPVTVGVLHRIEKLADRSEEEAVPPPTAGEIVSLVPLPEILSELLATGPSSKAVERSYDRLVGTLGSELGILGKIPVEDIARAEGELLAEAVTRLRRGQVIRDAGYDGEYGVIRLFEPQELKSRTAGGLLFDLPQRRAEASPQPTSRHPRESGGLVAPEPEGDSRFRGNDDEREGVKSPNVRDTTAASTGLLDRLDPDQRAAAERVVGPLLIVAGPGSGKTRTLTHRIAHLVAGGAAPESCLAITFTRRAAAEMRERLEALLPGAAARMPIHTFHSLGLAFLREHGEAAGLHRDARVAGEVERAALLQEVLEVSRTKAERLLRAISRAKRTGAPADLDLAEALARYDEALAQRNWIDFDDLVGKTIAALEGDPGLVALTRDQFRHVSVDEFQDVDDSQVRLLSLLVPSGGNLCVIGDPDQAIYGFRGADASCFDRFHRDHPGAAVIRLRRNYRSTGTIVTAASRFIGADGRTEPAAEIVRAMQDRISVHAAASDKAEAEFVVAEIEALLGGHSFFSIDSGRSDGRADDQLSFSDIAVLYRTDAQAEAVAEALGRGSMPFKKSSLVPLSEDPAVRALLAALEPEEGPQQLQQASERLRRDGADPASTTAALQRLSLIASRQGTDDRTAFLAAVALATEADFWDPRADRVSLLTLHAAKGLEFPVVFILGLEDGVLPLRFGEADPAATAEERRLFYVGMTRAMDRLLLCRARERRWRGGMVRLEASPFLGEIEAELLAHRRPDPAPRRPAERQLSLF
ncbi:AAA family ATPase [Mycobacterium sp. KBS0706]|uniref:UvrD-helicase domain-containing protein n=1 Tax=Mycobacterium sp. KBS0706 TaxID=2578109 RepID=UPI00110FB516|nr:UvrD-helicase domain-containing protein [Mycobacterium sp. KBS0706]TSD89578.1 AAA family ATPase [Mycobacterium sp. KBS0706]